MTLQNKVAHFARVLMTKANELTLADEKLVRIFNRVTGYSFGDNASGKAVTIDRAMQLATFWACTRIIAETIGSMPLNLYRRKRDDSREYADDHPLFGILKFQPNADFTAQEFNEGIVWSLVVHGNAYAYKQYGTTGGLIGVVLLYAQDMDVERDRDSGRVKYKYRDRGRQIVFDESEIWHIRGFGNGGLTGLSTLAYSRQTTGNSISAEEASGAMFRNGNFAGGVIEYDGVLKGKQRDEVNENVIRPMEGTLKSGGTVLLEGGFKYRNLEIHADDMQMLETRGFHVEEICRWFMVPPVLIGHQSGQSMWGSGIEQVNLFYLTYCLGPYLKRIQSSISRCLIRPEERAKIYAEHNVESILAMDSAGRAALYTMYVNNGIRSRNEIRKMENLARSDREGMDEFTVQGALMFIDKLGKTQTQPRSLNGDPTQFPEVNNQNREAA